MWENRKHMETACNTKMFLNFLEAFLQLLFPQRFRWRATRETLIGTTMFSQCLLLFSFSWALMSDDALPKARSEIFPGTPVSLKKI